MMRPYLLRWQRTFRRLAKGRRIYVVPARHQAKSVHEVIQDDTRRTDKVQIIPAKEVKPTFRTPCNFLTVGKIHLKLN